MSHLPTVSLVVDVCIFINCYGYTTSRQGGRVRRLDVPTVFIGATCDVLGVLMDLSGHLRLDFNSTV